MSVLRIAPAFIFRRLSCVNHLKCYSSTTLISGKPRQSMNKKNASLSTLTSPEVNSPRIQHVQNGLEIFLPKDINLKSKSVFVDYLWLYDHCRCPKCYRENVNQKEGDPRKITMDIKPETADITDTELHIKWSNTHQYNYKLDWILENIYEGYPRKPKYFRKYWTSSLKPQEYPKISVSSRTDENEFSREVLRNLLIYGFCFIDGVPPTLEGTEKITKMICPLQRGVWGDGAFLIETKEDYIDTAFLDVYLPPHNDGTHLVETPGLQVIHIIKQSEKGGENFILDGFKAAEILKQQDLFAFEYLSKTPVESSYKSLKEGFFYKHCETILRLHPYTKEMLQIRYNFTDITPIKIIPQSEIRHFYKSLAALANILYNQSNHIVFKLYPGTMIIYDNWRLLHGRQAFQGERQLVGCFMSHKDFHSRARILGIL